MSFDEMESILIADRERYKRDLERDRINWFFTVIAPGMSKAKEPSDIYTFEWEVEKSKGKKISKDRARDIGSKLEKQING